MRAPTAASGELTCKVGGGTDPVVSDEIGPSSLRCHVAPRLVSVPALTIENPVHSETTGVPSAFCHRMSGLPSPLKSAAAITCQDDPGFGSVTVLVYGSPLWFGPGTTPSSSPSPSAPTWSSLTGIASGEPNFVPAVPYRQ